MKRSLVAIIVLITLTVCILPSASAGEKNDGAYILAYTDYWPESKEIRVALTNKETGQIYKGEITWSISAKVFVESMKPNKDGVMSFKGGSGIGSAVITATYKVDGRSYKASTTLKITSKGMEMNLPRISAQSMPSDTVETGYTGTLVLASNYAEDAYKLAQRLSASEMNGRATGGAGYAKAVTLMENELKAAGVQPYSGNSLRVNHSVGYAELISEQVILNGKTLKLMNDYMPFSRTPTGKLSGTYDIVYLGAWQGGRDNTDVRGKVVMFDYRNADGTLSDGILDRVLFAQQRGAAAVLIVEGFELLVGNYEHPLSNSQPPAAIPALYITKDAAKQLLGKESNYVKTTVSGKKITINLEIKRESKTADSLLGVIPGLNKSKYILITTNLDGFGALPDGRYFQSTIAGTAAPAELVQLARYFKRNPPPCSIIVAIAGCKWTGQEGINALIKKIDMSKVVAAIDIYAGGGNGDFHVSYSNKAYKSKAESIKSSAFFNTSFGNGMLGQYYRKLESCILLRASDEFSWIDNSITDTEKRLDRSNIHRELNSLYEIITGMYKNHGMTMTARRVNPVTKKVPRASKEHMTVETECFTIVYDEEFAKSITPYFLDECDAVYKRLSSLYYNPALAEKPMILFIKDAKEAARIAERTDLYDDPEKAGGGFASITKPILYCKEVALGTITHEFNHVISKSKFVQPSISLNFAHDVHEEVTGNTNLVWGYIYDQKFFANNEQQMAKYFSIVTFGGRSVKKNAQNYKQFDFKRAYVQGMDKTQDQWQETYQTLGSMYTFIYYVYGDNVARRAQSRVYQLTTPEKLAETMVIETRLTVDEFLQAWSKWILSEGKETTTKALQKAKEIGNKLTEYDTKMLK